MVAQCRHELLAHGERLGQQRALLGPAVSSRGERRQHVLLGLLAEARHVLEAAVLGCTAQVVQRRSAELVVQQADRLGPRPGMRVISTRPGGIFALSLSADGIEPVSSRASIFSAIVFPTPASSAARPCRASSSTETPGLADRLGGVAVGDDPVDHGAVELVQARQLLEGLGYVARCACRG